MAGMVGCVGGVTKCRERRDEKEAIENGGKGGWMERGQ